MLRSLVTALAVLVPACSSSSTDVPVASVVDTAKAGTVVELAGSVTATRAGKPRALAIGAEVSSDDDVATAADGKVTIELAHNHARWSLGPDRKGTVRESVAWGLPLADGSAVAVAGDTSAGGRHAERSAVDTSASTIVTPKTPTPTPPPTPQPTPPTPERGGHGLVGIGSGGGGGGNGIGLGSIGTLGHGAGGGTGTGYGAGHGRLGGSHTTKAPTIQPGATTVQGALPKEVIARIVRQHFGALRMCYEQGLQRDPNLHGKVTVKFVIDKTGAVTIATATGFDGDVDTCLAARFRTFAFPAPEGGIVTVQYPLEFAPE